MVQMDIARLFMCVKLLAIFICVFFDGRVAGDVRLKTNISNVDVAAMRKVIDGVDLHAFEFKFDQFYNPIFGKKQIGVLAEEVKTYLPEAVGVVEKRAVGNSDDEEPIMLENVHVLNTETLFMANVGATKALSRIVDDLVDLVQKTSKDADSGRQAHEAISSMKEQQMRLEMLAKEANDRSQGTIKLEHALSSIEKDSQLQRSEQQQLMAKLDRIDLSLQAEIKEQGDLHREITVGSIKLQTQMENVIEKVKRLEQDYLDERSENKEKHSKHVELIETKSTELEGKHTELSKKLEQTCANLDQHGKSVEAAKGEVMAQKENLAFLSKEFETVKGEQKAQKDSIQQIQMETSQRVMDQEVHFNQTIAKVWDAIESIRAVMTELRADLDKQAGEELVEKRKLTEAEARLEEARAESERTREEEKRKTAQVMAEIELEKLTHQENATLARIEQEETMRVKRELEVLRAKEEAEIRQANARAEQERELEKAKRESELAKLQQEGTIARETALAQAQEETKRERENFDLRKAHTIAAIQTVAQETVNAVKLVASNPMQLVQFLGMMIAVAFGIYGAREFMILWRKYMELKVGQPSLVRETSMNRSATWHRFKSMVSEYKSKARVLLAKEEQKQELLKEQGKEQDRKACFRHYMSDVVLPNHQLDQLDRVARATKAAHDRGTPLRHVLFYGPPGTGKTMVARHLAQWCDLDYAIMSGADVAPLKERAVTEIHNLFKWANSTRRGVVLFIDEADAFLATRDNGPISESLRNALTALLFHTGSASCRVMMVLATNRPGDLDRAVIDRVDESVQFSLPGLQERKLLVRQYYSMFVKSYDTENVISKYSLLDETANAMHGFSGREISKFMCTLEAHIQGSLQHALSKDLFDQVFSHTLEEHNKLEDLQNGKIKLY